MGSKYRCDPAVMRKCECAELCGDHIYNGDDCECAKVNQGYMPPTERQELAVYRASGLTPDELPEAAALLQAKRAGRCVALPCRIGDAVSATVTRPFDGHAIPIQGVVSDAQMVIRVSYMDGLRHVDFLSSDFGKTVFLTPAEEEAALAAQEEA